MKRDLFGGLLASREATKAIRKTVVFARRERVQTALVGGFALAYYGSDRLTRDVDFACSRLPRSSVLGIPLPMGGRRTWLGIVPVDMIPPEETEAPGLWVETVRRARSTRRGFRVARPEHLAAMKLEAGRPKDVLDLDWLLQQRRRGKPLVDRRVVRGVVRRHLGEQGLFAFDLAELRSQGKTRCVFCNRVVAIVRGSKVKAHDFQHRRCRGSERFA